MKRKDKLIEQFFNNRYRKFFYENPKAIIILLSCIKESHFTQEIADIWFKEGSPIFSKDNTISKMINENMILLDKKVGKTHYYRTNNLMLSRILSELYNQDLYNLKKNISDEIYIDYINIKLLKNIFKNPKQVERLGLNYLNYIFTNKK